MTPEAILQEEANIGARLLGSLKKRAIEQNAWASFSGLKRALEGAEPDLEELRTIQLLWSTVVRRLHVRIYRNPEFALTLTEQLEQLERLLSSVPGRPAQTAVRDSEWSRARAGKAAKEDQGTDPCRPAGRVPALSGGNVPAGQRVGSDALRHWGPGYFPGGGSHRGDDYLAGDPWQH